VNYDALVKGVDVSHWQGMIDWPKLKADGVDFAYIKAVQNVYEDPLFSTNATGADKVDIVALAYPFLTSGDSEASIAKFDSVVGPTMPAVLDWEAAGVMDSTVLLWADGLLKRPTMAYYGIDPPDTIIQAIAALPRAFPEYNAFPRLPAWDGVSTPDWSRQWLIWQRSQRGTFQGEKGSFDLDVLACTLPMFRRWCATGSFAVPATPPAPKNGNWLVRFWDELLGKS
jgi:lysozyme